jgi:hypothetical protein
MEIISAVKEIITSLGKPPTTKYAKYRKDIVPKSTTIIANSLVPILFDSP